MSALIPTVKAEKEDEKSANVGRFLARCGVLRV
jgi:hypothetical protein